MHLNNDLKSNSREFKAQYIIETAISYEKNAETYCGLTQQLDKFPSIQSHLRGFCDNLSGDRILDVGFGSGRDLTYFLNRKFDAEGIDLTMEFVNRAKRNLNAQVFQSDMRTFKPQNGLYSGIWCCASLLHLKFKDAETAIRNFFQILEKEGILFVSVKKGFGSKVVKGDVFNNCQGRYFKYYDGKSIRQLLEKNGFEIMEMSEGTSSINITDIWINVLCKRKEHVIHGNIIR